jgi:hypothetical protein
MAQTGSINQMSVDTTDVFTTNKNLIYEKLLSYRFKKLKMPTKSVLLLQGHMKRKE